MNTEGIILNLSDIIKYADDNICRVEFRSGNNVSFSATKYATGTGTNCRQQYVSGRQYMSLHVHTLPAYGSCTGGMESNKVSVRSLLSVAIIFAVIVDKKSSVI